MVEAARTPARWPAALRAALARPAVWLALLGCELALALAPALVYFVWLAPALEHRTQPYALLRDLGTVFRFDQRAALIQVDASIETLGAVLVLAAMLLGAFAAGGWLGLFLSGTRAGGLRGFVAGGTRFFGRFVRLILLSALLLALATWIWKGAPWEQLVLRGIVGVPGSDVERLETLASEHSALLVRQLQAVLYALSVALVLVWGDLTRTRLALFDTRSVVWAGIESALLLLVHPLRVLRPLLALFAIEVAIVSALGWLAHAVEGRVQDGMGIAALLLLGLLALAWRIVLRGARYHAAVAVSRALVRPIAKPDPWAWGRLEAPPSQAPVAS